MAEFTCGKCSQDRNLPIDARINLALSMKRGAIYTCVACGEHRTLPVFRNSNGSTITAENAESSERTRTPNTSEEAADLVNEETIEQISLF